MSGVIQTAGQALGLEKAEGAYNPQLNQLGSQLQDKINNPTALSNALYTGYANKATNAVNQNIGATRGITPQQAAEMQRNTGASLQQDAANQAASAGLQGQAQSMSMLGNLLMGQNQQDLAQQNAQSNKFGQMVSGVAGAGAGAGAFGKNLQTYANS